MCRCIFVLARMVGYAPKSVVSSPYNVRMLSKYSTCQAALPTYTASLFSWHGGAGSPVARKAGREGNNGSLVFSRFLPGCHWQPKWLVTLGSLYIYFNVVCYVCKSVWGYCECKFQRAPEASDPPRTGAVGCELPDMNIQDQTMVLCKSYMSP